MSQPTTPGSGAQGIRQLIRDEWQVSRSGRDDVPPIADPIDTNVGVAVVADRQRVGLNRAVHDIVHVYHPQANPPSRVDKGYNEEGITETVQVDVDVTDRTDQTTDERLSARDRLVGTRDASNEAEDYGGILGELWYVLDSKRRGYKEWDVVRFDLVGLFLGNSNADASIHVELEIIAQDTVV